VASDASGKFELPVTVQLPGKVIVSFIGYKNDTILVNRGQTHLRVELDSSQDLDEVVVTGRRPGAHYSVLEPILTNVITSSELQRAACCNLSEAFETNASIDVSFTDAVSGAQQIQMLGLAGTYSQILTENMPTIRGLGQPFGLGFIPGPWMESIQISKGAASVINGYESITGQINVELNKPESSEQLFYNFYVNDFGRLESTINAALDINPRLSTMIMAHGEVLSNQIDHNQNSFLDHPLLRKYNIINRYRYDIHGVMESQFGFRVLQEEREGGQLAFFSNGTNWGSNEYYGFGVNTNRYEAFAKTGFFFRRMPDASIGTQLNFTHHDLKSHYGPTAYDGTQNTFYSNLLFENSLWSPDHRITTGFSYLFDDYSESLSDSVFTRRESVPGVFGQYSFSIPERLAITAGLRFDFHNIYGTFTTPRIHARYNVTHSTVIRGSAGKGYRVPNLVAENTGLLVSNRRWVVLEEILPEEAWNYGMSITQNMVLFNNEASFVVEYYRTDFQNQLIVDVDSEAHHAFFYNLHGKSYANNFQAEFSFSPLRRMDILAAYRVTDVKTTIGDQLEVKPFVNRYRGLVTASWATGSNNWQFDVTAQFNGPSRIPDTNMLPADMQLPGQSPAYTLMLAQVTYRWRNLDLYMGGENLTNFVQHHPILGADDPFGDHFDGSMIWGPIMGRTIYFGLRYAIQR
jgi:outer membrane receptor for ferrienterochelin and colicins